MVAPASADAPRREAIADRGGGGGRSLTARSAASCTDPPPTEDASAGNGARVGRGDQSSEIKSRSRHASTRCLERDVAWWFTATGAVGTVHGSLASRGNSLSRALPLFMPLSTTKPAAKAGGAEAHGGECQVPSSKRTGGGSRGSSSHTNKISLQYPETSQGRGKK